MCVLLEYILKNCIYIAVYYSLHFENVYDKIFP